jgi:hypothetical protein
VDLRAPQSVIRHWNQSVPAIHIHVIDFKTRPPTAFTRGMNSKDLYVRKDDRKLRRPRKRRDLNAATEIPSVRTLLQGIILGIIAGHHLSHLWREGVGLRLKEEQNLSFRDPSQDRAH